MFHRYFPDSELKHASNWKNVFIMEILEQKENLQGLSESDKQEVERQRLLPQSTHFQMYLRHLRSLGIVRL